MVQMHWLAIRPNGRIAIRHSLEIRPAIRADSVRINEIIPLPNASSLELDLFRGASNARCLGRRRGRSFIRTSGHRGAPR